MYYYLSENMTKEVLSEIAKEIYTNDTESLAKELYDQIISVRLDNKNALTGALSLADISKDNIKKLINEKFGKEIFDRVALLKRIAGIDVSEKGKHLNNLRKSFIQLSDDISIIIIKLAERLVQLRNADRWGHDNLLALSEESLYFYAPIAQMLGIRKIYQEMEDISFKNLYPEDFNQLDMLLNRNMGLYTSKLSEMRADLEKAIKDNKINARIQSRVKRPYSIYRKLVKQKITFDKIYDLLALRVITSSSEHCYLTLGVVHSKWMPIDGRFRDWITYPKSNGYRSIQTTVHTRSGDKFEIQIRTEEMHEEAEFGSSAHWAYKQGSGDSGGTWLRRLHDFLDNEEYFDNPFEFFDSLKSEMKRDYINVLTPKGKIISLPEGSSPIDYAFAVHTDLGYNVTGARINGRYAKLKTELKSGDVIEIISSNSATPSRDWLNIVKTSRARSKIVRWFKKNEKELFVIQGKNAWDKLKEQYKRKLQGHEDDQKFKKALASIGYSNNEDFYYAISSKAVKCSLYLLKKIYPDAFKKSLEVKKTSSGIEGRKRAPNIKVEGLSNLEIKLSKCCNPIKGEPIIAYITKKSEMKIHSKDCPYLKQSHLEPENFKKAEWMAGEFLQTVRFKLFGENYTKMLQAAADAADSDKITILSTGKLSLKGDNEGLAIEVEVKDISQLESFINRLKSSNAVESVKN